MAIQYLTDSLDLREESGCMERTMGIEPTLEAWEAPVLPLNYTRLSALQTLSKNHGQRDFIREPVNRQ